MFILPSRYEGMPNALLEAMASGKANVATAVNGAPELVRDGETGFLIESENVEQLFEKIEIILLNDELRKSMETASLERVRSFFTMDKMTLNLEQLLTQQIHKSTFQA